MTNTSHLTSIKYLKTSSMSADSQQLTVSKADLPHDEASYPLFTEQPLPLASGHVLGKGRSANTKDLPNTHPLLLHVGQLYVHPPFTFLYIEDLDLSWMSTKS